MMNLTLKQLRHVDAPAGGRPGAGPLPPAAGGGCCVHSGPGGLTCGRSDAAPGKPPESQGMVLPGRGPGPPQFRGAHGGTRLGAFGIKGLAARIYFLVSFCAADRPLVPQSRLQPKHAQERCDPAEPFWKTCCQGVEDRCLVGEDVDCRSKQGCGHTL